MGAAANGWVGWFSARRLLGGQMGKRPLDAQWNHLCNEPIQTSPSVHARAQTLLNARRWE